MREDLKVLIDFIENAENEGVIDPCVKDDLMDFAKWHLVNKM